MNILVYLEERNGQIRKPSLEAISAALSVAGSNVFACIVGSNTASLLTDPVKKLGAQKIVVVDAAPLASYSSRATAKAIAAVAGHIQADVVLIGATARGRDLAPRVSVRLSAGYVPDITSLAIEGADLLATHPVYAGKANVTVKVTTPVKVYSTRPNLWSTPKTEAAEAAVENLSVSFDDKDFAEKTTGLTLSQGKLDVAEADFIVSGGRGMRGPENWGLIEELANAFGGATGASRAVVDAGWRPHSEQVGQTGKTVSPTVYVAVGISGAVQHLAGMSTSKTIVAINKDANAPIFGLADYGIVGDAFEVLPALVAEVKRVKAH